MSYAIYIFVWCISFYAAYKVGYTLGDLQGFQEGRLYGQRLQRMNRKDI